MKEDKLYQNLIVKMREVSEVKPQTLGPLTFPYKLLAPYFKVYPWRILIFIAFFLSFLVYLFFGVSIVSLVSLLQHGF